MSMSSSDAPASAGTPGSPSGATGGNAGQGGTPEAGASRPEAEKKDDIERRIAGISAVLGRLQATVERLAKIGGNPDGKPDGKSTEPLTQKVQELETRVRELSAKEERLREQAAVATVARSLREHGVSDALAERYARLLVRVEQAGRIKADDNGNGGFRVEVLDGDGLPVSVDKWIAAYLQTDEGRALLPHRQQPMLGGAPYTQAPGARVVTREDLAMGRVSREDILKGRVRIVE
ncbi:MAG: hypothetical protein N3A38_15650 [Planctomycetota bacterium]|nr:hypothetical protein [Planctomycetota bacterium]